MAIIFNRQNKKNYSTTAKLPESLQVVLESGDFNAIENILVATIEQTPQNLDFFIPLFRILLRHGKQKIVETCFQLLLDALREHGYKETEIELLISMVIIWPEYTEASSALFAILKEKYSKSPNFNLLCSMFDMSKSKEPLKTMEALEKWLCFDKGTLVYMPKKGAGKVTELNFKLNVIRVQFEWPIQQLLSFKIEEAHRTLQILEPGHFLYDRLESPKELQHLAIQRPSELLQRLFRSMGNSIPLSEIREMLLGIIEEKEWNSWWAKVRQDARITCSSGPKAICTWSESAQQAEDAILEQFYNASTADRLELAIKHASRCARLEQEMSRALASSVASIVETNPVLAIETLLTLQKIAKKEWEIQQNVFKLLLQKENVAKLITEIQNKAFRKTAISFLKEYRADWPQLYVQLLSCENDNQILTYLYEMLLADKGLCGLIDDLIIQTISVPDTAPSFFVWLCRQMNARQELKRYADWNFLQQLIRTLSKSMFKSQMATLRKCFDAGGAADIAISTLDSSQARQLLSVLEKDVGLEDYRKNKIIDELKRRYSDLDQNEQEIFYVTLEALEAKRQELKQLVERDIPQNSLEIKRTREYGDLRENFEYHAARARQELLSSRAKTLHDQLKLARAIDPNTIDTSTVTVGTRIFLVPVPVDSDGTKITLTILGPWDSNPAIGVLSYTARAAEPLLGKKAGDIIEFDGKKYTIEKIEAWGK